MDLRLATARDVAALDEIALAAKAHWGYAAEQLDAWRDDLAVPPASLAARPAWVAELAGRPVGFVQVATDVTPWALWGLWVLPACMGRGIGRRLLAQAAQFAAAHGQREIAIDSDPHAEAFYRRCGAWRVGVVAAPLPGDPGRVRPQLRLSTQPALA